MDAYPQGKPHLKSVFSAPTLEGMLCTTAAVRRGGSQVCVAVMVHGEDRGQGCWEQGVMAQWGEKAPWGASLG